MNKVNTIGLAYRAGKVVLGTDNVIKLMRSKKISLVLLAHDASDNTIKKITDKSTFYQIKTITKYNSETLSQAIGKSNIKVIGVADNGFSKLLLD